MGIIVVSSTGSARLALLCGRASDQGLRGHELGILSALSANLH
jgi:hypothetical protein